MNKLLGVLMIAATVCASAAAQQGNAAAQQAKAAAHQGDKDVTAASTFRARLLAQQGQAAQPTPEIKLAREIPLWVLKDGAVYLNVGFFGNEILIPVPGGGASGCFGDPPERMQKVVTSIGAFPPRPMLVTPPRQ